MAITDIRLNRNPRWIGVRCSFMGKEIFKGGAPGSEADESLTSMSTTGRVTKQLIRRVMTAMA